MSSFAILYSFEGWREYDLGLYTEDISRWRYQELDRFRALNITARVGADLKIPLAQKTEEDEDTLLSHHDQYKTELPGYDPTYFEKREINIGTIKSFDEGLTS